MVKHWTSNPMNMNVHLGDAQNTTGQGHVKAKSCFQ